MNKNILYVLFFLSLFSIFNLKAINLGSIDLFLEDIIIFISTLTLFGYIANKNNEINRDLTVKLWYFYIFFIALITTIRYFFGEIEIISFFFILKEIEFFIFFILSYSVGRMLSNGKIAIYVNIIIIPSLVWGALQVILGIKAHYGIGGIGNEAPSISGMSFGVISFIYLYLWLNNKIKKLSIIYFCLYITSSLFVILTVSRGAILAMLCANIFFWGALFVFKNESSKLKYILSSISIILIITILNYFFDFIYLFNTVIERFSRIDQSSNIRFNNWGYLLQHNDSLGWIVGMGKSFPNVITGSSYLQVDNQYIRNIIEMGLIGSVIWFILIFSFIYTVFRANKKVITIIAITFTLLFLVYSMVSEAFQVSRISLLYWAFTGLLIGIIKKEKIIKD
ncbi:O-antigen ligase family protein [Jeotgalibacillus haloalkalitolerans]|uniref:O-antigen ligase family protein n=1 Tax=Jeotgalibacillus haloalkalitolerans TaxID=3104292 RepID=A0ABU5KJJ6_9BACL|nr:O-antigen ligase family protein [Jeotgalibacillus sp. HH7-29]MDZ5711314.1 O-antigen ligase family protein [Jeotgalibacillus sp. HH7-29]